MADNKSKRHIYKKTLFIFWAIQSAFSFKVGKMLTKDLKQIMLKNVKKGIWKGKFYADNKYGETVKKGLPKITKIVIIEPRGWVAK